MIGLRSNNDKLNHCCLDGVRMMIGLWEMSGGKAVTNHTGEKSGSARSSRDSRTWWCELIPPPMHHLYWSTTQTFST